MLGGPSIVRLIELALRCAELTFTLNVLTLGRALLATAWRTDLEMGRAPLCPAYYEIGSALHELDLGR